MAIDDHAGERGRLTAIAILVTAGIMAPGAYTGLALLDLVPMTVPIYVTWLAWLQLVHAAAAVALWRRRAAMSTRAKATALYWGGLAFWYWLPAPVYHLLTMNLDELQLTWSAFAFFWEVPVVGGAFVLAARRLFPLRAPCASRAPADVYRAVMHYPTIVGALLFGFTLAGYALGTLQLRVFAALPLIEQAKSLSHGLVISLLLAVFYHLALDRVLAPQRTRLEREARLGGVVARTVAGRSLGVSLAVAVGGFALLGLLVLQAFQGLVRGSAVTTLNQDLPRLAAAPETARHLGAFPEWGEGGRLLLLRGDESLPADAFAPATRRAVAAAGATVLHDTRGDLKVVGIVDAPRLGGRLVGVIRLADGYGPLRSAAGLLAIAGGCILIVSAGMLVLASLASTRAVRALSSAVRRVEALDARQQRLQAVVEHLPEGVVLLERDGRIALANPLARTRLAAVAAMSPAGQVTEVGGLSLARLLAGPEVEAREITAGAAGVFQVAARPLAGGHGAVVVIREVTREREAQKAAQQQARLASVGQLAAGIAHDFNNILMTIVNSAELGMRKQSDGPFVRRRLEVIVDQGERAAALVRQILDFSRQSLPSLKRVDVARLLEQTLGLLEHTLPESIAISVETTGGPFVIRADPDQLTQVLANLAVNAGDVMPLGGALRFHLALEERDSAASEARPGPGRWVVITVADSGAGMPPEILERAFDPFFTTKAPGRGTGLGLSQAYGIVTEHGGHITADSRPGEGTRFTLYLPSLTDEPHAVEAGPARS